MTCPECQKHLRSLEEAEEYFLELEARETHIAVDATKAEDALGGALGYPRIDSDVSTQYPKDWDNGDWRKHDLGKKAGKFREIVSEAINHIKATRRIRSIITDKYGDIIGILDKADQEYIVIPTNDLGCTIKKKESIS